MSEWRVNEDEFQLLQLKERAEIRIKQKRPKPIDYLLQVTNQKKGDLKDPLKIIEESDKNELSEVELIMKLETSEMNKRYWNSIHLILNSNLKNTKPNQRRIQTQVSLQIKDLFNDKTLQELNEIQSQIISKLQSEVDFEYWESVLECLMFYKAKLTITEIYNHYKSLEYLEVDVKTRHIKEPFLPEMEPLMGEITMNYRHLNKLTLEEFNSNLLEMRLKMKQDYLNYIPIQESSLSIGELEFFKEAICDLHFEERVLASQGLLDNKPLELEQYELREPYYLVRVLSGLDSLDWKTKKTLKKVVFGYKFYIYYPDLIDKSKPPFFRLHQDSESGTLLDEETEIITFCAGPPYQDLAFRIIKQEWEHNHNHGYKSEFKQGGILHLWFNFTRKKYQT